MILVVGNGRALVAQHAVKWKVRASERIFVFVARRFSHGAQHERASAFLRRDITKRLNYNIILYKVYAAAHRDALFLGRAPRAPRSHAANKKAKNWICMRANSQRA